MKKIYNLFPIIKWISNYKEVDLRGDMVSGITVTMMIIPQAMSYAMLAGLPPAIGLYSSIIPLIIYAVFGTSRQLAVGPVAMVSLLIVSGISPLAAIESDKYIYMVIFLTVLVGVIQLLMGILKLGFLTNFMSHPIISGFTSAAALIIAFSQLKHILGINIERTENIFKIIWMTINQINEIHILTVAIGLIGIAMIFILKKINPLIPGPMILVIVSTIMVWFLKLNEYGVKIVETVPKGFPDFKIPQIDLNTLFSLLPIALTISFVGFMESIAVAKKIAQEKHYEIDSNRELIGLGLSNIAGSFFKSMPVTGGFSRTAVNNSAGANTNLSSIITAVFVTLAVLFLTPLFYFIPNAILASVIIVAVIGLVDINEVKHLWKVKKEDLAILAITFFSTLVFGVIEGIVIGVVISIIGFFIKTTKPHYAILGKISGSDDYRNVKNYNVEIPENILIIRFDAQFYYGNVSFLKDVLRDKIKNSNDDIRAVIIESSSINQLDSSADKFLHEIIDKYKTQKIVFYFSGVKVPVLDVMKKSGFYDKVGHDKFFYNTHQAVLKAKSEM